MSEPRKHHYVPQCYLKQFACENKGAPKIYVYDKKNRKQFCDEIRNVAEEKDFYKIESKSFPLLTPDNDPLYYEHHFSKLIESKIPALLNQVKMLHTMTVPDKEILSYEMKKTLSVFILTQLFRTPKARHTLMKKFIPKCQQEVETLKKAIQKMEFFPNKGAYLRKLNSLTDFENLINATSLSHFTNPEVIELYSDFLINNRSWVIYDNALYKRFPFVTSDNPVVMYNIDNEDLGFGTRNGIEVFSTVFSLPLTPRFLLALYHKQNIIGNFMDSFQDKFLPVNERKFVRNINKIHVNQCERFFYSNLQIFE